MEQTNNLKKIKILYLTTSSKIGGVEQVILGLVKDINRDLFNIEVCTLSPKGLLHDELDTLKIKNYSLGIVKNNWVSIAKAFYRLYILLRKEKYQIVNSWLFHASVMSTFISKFEKKACLVESRQYADYMYKYNFKLKQFLDKISSQRADHIIACSDAAKEILVNYEKADPRKVTVVYNGTSINRFRFQNLKQREQIRENLQIKDKIVLSYTAHFRQEKGHRYLLRAISKIKTQYPNIVLLLIGDGVLRNELEVLTKQFNIEDNVRFLGYRTDIPDLLSATDIYVHPTTNEGFGIAIIEAMAVGVPVIATNVGGIPEIITDEKYGVLVPAENPQALADAISDLIMHPEKRKSMSEEERKHVEITFTNQIMANKYMAIYSQLVEDRCRQSHTVYNREYVARMLKGR